MKNKTGIISGFVLGLHNSKRHVVMCTYGILRGKRFGGSADLGKE